MSTTMHTTTARFTYPRVGSLVHVTYRTRKPGEVLTYVGTVLADRYPDYALGVGELRIPWSFVVEVVPC